MSVFVGIRHEDKYKMERRAPLTPRHVDYLVTHKNLDIVVQKSPKRIFTEEEYIRAGAVISESLAGCSVILGVKEIPIEAFERKKTYVFFSHVIKGQPYNMPMLRRMMELECNLIDYEKVVDEQNKRLIFFGKYAGLAGMINSLWALGQRLDYYGFKSKLLKIRQAHEYDSLSDAKDDISAVGQLIAEKGIPEDLIPFTIGFTGYGNVSQGAQEICGLLPVKEISPDKLLNLKHRKHLPNNIIYKVIFKEEHLFEPIEEGKEFDLRDYFERGSKGYRNAFEKYVPYLTMLINCIFWDKKYPKLLTRDYLKKLYSKGNPKLIVIGDISCDINGAIEATKIATEIGDPVFVYNPYTDGYTMGCEGEGILDMTVDILPAELPRDASDGFADVLVNFIKPIADADYEEEFEDLDLPRAIKKGLILHNGKLTPDFQYIQKFLEPLEVSN
ncbi:MAG: bifunctional lysine ketoglutarate reductase /saccharopine dehydrogenase family protein [Bacteroidetes bacterium]|nr:bifunctional lysine ketoglutarate reductase /saccharopine dehydrogenase family protein [Bacteroidota bacterium]